MIDNSLQSNVPMFEKLFGGSAIIGRVITSLFYLGIIGIMLLEVSHYFVGTHGDESYYVDYTKAIGDNGIYKEVANGNPVGYTAIVYALSKLGLSLLLTGRFLTLISTFAFYLSLKYIGRNIFNLSGAYLQLALLTCLLGVLGSHFYFIFCPDMFYYVIIMWIIVLMWRIVNKWAGWQIFALVGTLISVTILIRPLSLIFFMAFLLALFFISFFTKVGIWRKASVFISFIAAFIIIFLFQQYPSLHKSGGFAFENKINDPNTKATWEQRRILTTLKKEKGEKTDGNFYVSWKQCDNYLKQYGPNSLPKGATQVLFWSPTFFIKHFIFGLIDVLRGFLRDTGFVFIFPFIFLFRPSFAGYKKFAFFTVISLVYIAIYLFITLDSVEIRHILIPMVISALAGIAILKNLMDEGKKYAVTFLNLQMAALFLILLLDIKFFVSAFLSFKMM